MGQFSDDGQWWWNGAQWIAASQVVLPDLPMTEMERSGKLTLARRDRAQGRRRFWTLGLPFSILINAVTNGNYMAVNAKGFPIYRAWTMEQLSLATACLLGPEEPMLAGEVSVGYGVDAWDRTRAIAVTAAHVLIFRIDHFDGQPRWIALAARASDVKIKTPAGFLGVLWPFLEVTAPSGRWTINGFTGEFHPEPVVAAWRRAAATAPAATQ